MGKRRNDTLLRRTGQRPYRPVCWVSTEGTTERDYFRMAVFKDARASVKYPKDVHPSRRNPTAVLKRLQKEIGSESLRKGDEAWIVVDVDNYEGELGDLLAWCDSHPGYHLAVSNPKFELFLVMHFEKANGCTTASKVDSTLNRYLPGYDKRLTPTQFSLEDVRNAVANARAKRASSAEVLPGPDVTDAFMLVESLLGDSILG